MTPKITIASVANLFDEHRFLAAEACWAMSWRPEKRFPRRVQTTGIISGETICSDSSSQSLSSSFSIRILAGQWNRQRWMASNSHGVVAESLIWTAPYTYRTSAPKRMSFIWRNQKFPKINDEEIRGQEVGEMGGELLVGCWKFLLRCWKRRLLGWAS